MANTSTGMKVGYYAAADVQSKILSTTLDAYDIVFTSDTNELIFISPSLTPVPIQSRVYRFADKTTAETMLNSMGDTYEGQLVGVKNTKGVYHAYVVNKDTTTNKYILSDMGESVDYDNITDAPITNKVGTIAAPTVLDTLTDGTYNVSGPYCFTTGSTVINPCGNEIFMIYGSNITHLSAKNMSRMTYNSALSQIVEDPYVTVNDVLSYGKATSAEVQALFK